VGQYTSATATAARLIAKYGRSDISVYRPAVGTTSDATKPWKPDVEGTDQLLGSGLHAVLLDPREAAGFRGEFSFPIFLRGKLDDGDSIAQMASAVTYMIPAELAPNELQPNDLVVTQGRRYAVMRSDALRPGDDATVLVMAYLKET